MPVQTIPILQQRHLLEPWHPWIFLEGTFRASSAWIRLLRPILKLRSAFYRHPKFGGKRQNLHEGRIEQGWQTEKWQLHHSLCLLARLRGSTGIHMTSPVPRLIWPAWRAPIVGTRPIDLPSRRSLRRQVRNSVTVRNTSISCQFLCLVSYFWNIDQDRSGVGCVPDID